MDAELIAREEDIKTFVVFECANCGDREEADSRWAIPYITRLEKRIIELNDRMTLKRYQEAALRTNNEDPLRKVIDLYLNKVLGLVGEAGEVADMIKKQVFHGHQDITSDDIADELGDVLWYLACLADDIGVPLEEIARRNIEKLKKRYPEGFSEEASRDRKDV